MKKTFAFKPMPVKSKGTPSRPAMPPGQAKVRPAKSTNHGQSKIRTPKVTLPVVEQSITAITPKGKMDKLASDHDVNNSWHQSDRPSLDKLRGLDNAASRVTNPKAADAIEKAKGRR